MCALRTELPSCSTVPLLPRSPLLSSPAADPCRHRRGENPNQGEDGVPGTERRGAHNECPLRCVAGDTRRAPTPRLFAREHRSILLTCFSSSNHHKSSPNHVFEQMDVYRIGTLLEGIRELVSALTQDGKRVKARGGRTGARLAQKQNPPRVTHGPGRESPTLFAARLSTLRPTGVRAGKHGPGSVHGHAAAAVGALVAPLLFNPRK